MVVLHGDVQETRVTMITDHIHRLPDIYWLVGPAVE